MAASTPSPSPPTPPDISARGVRAARVAAQAPRASDPHATRIQIKRAADIDAMRAIRRVRTALLLVGLVISYGTSGYQLIEGWPWLDALYMTMMTISTVGYREVHALSHAGIAFTITLMLFGVGSSLYTLSAVFELLLSEQFNHWRQIRRMQNHIDRMKQHYIICGYGRIGKQVCADLSEAKVPFVVVDNNPQRCAALLESGIPFVEGDATLDEVLLAAGIERAKGLVGALSKDADNVMMVISARGLNQQLYIIARAALPEVESKLKRAGADEVISPYVVGGRRIALSMLRPAVADFLNAVLYDPQLQAEFNEFVVEPDSPLVGQTLTEAGMAHAFDVLPIAILRDDRLIVSPLPNTVLEAHDTLIVVTQVDSLRTKKTGARK